MKLLTSHKQIAHNYTVIIICCLLIVGSCKQNADSSYAQEKSEIENFMTHYKQLLQKAKFDSVALLYVDTGFVSLGNGQMLVQNIDSIKALYARMPKIENDFYWAKTRIDVLSKDAALVTSFFYWHDKNGSDTTKECYTGLFVKSGPTWKILHEHESLDVETIAKLIRKSESQSK